MTETIWDEVSHCKCVIFDGTYFYDDELARLEMSGKTARAMGHLPVGEKGGSLQYLRSLDQRKIYTHLNNTNPLLIEDSPQRLAVEKAEIEVAFDGMELDI